MALRFQLDKIEAETFVRRVEYHAELGSTNNLALQLANCDRRDLPALVLAERQTAGRGRGANQWWSGEGALTFSVVLDLRVAAEANSASASLSLIAGLAVCEALGQFVPALKMGLKWPNDILHQGKKICGILVENPAQPRRRVVMGIGVNVNNSLSAAPDELRSTATSLSDATGCEHDVHNLLVLLLRQLETLVDRAERGQLDLERCCKAFCVLTGRDVRLAWGKQRYSGRCLGIDGGGRLVLETAAGVQRFVSGTIEGYG